MEVIKMANNNLEEEEWDTLIYSIRQGNCILMLGPDAAVEEVDGQTHLLTEILANQLAEKIDEETRGKINPSDLAQVSQYYSIERGRNSLEARASSFFYEREGMSTNLHRNLAALPFYFTITTTPDSMFLEALKKEGKEPMVERYHFNGDNPDIVGKGTREKPLLFYLYGTVSEPGSLLLTENDLLDFLVALISEKRPLPDNIRSELQDEHKSFLFLGFGLRHWYLRLLLHVLQGRNKGSHSFAMEQFMPENAEELQRTIYFYKKSNYKINIFKGELNHFAGKLREKYLKQVSKNGTNGNGTKRVLDSGAPQVFICHASEDKDYAASLYKTLADAGIKPWLDKQNLRGGDDWNRQIEKTIQEIDYFVLLQSRALADKQIGYVNREINSALDRKKEFRRGSRFIIPVKIEECPLLEDVHDLQTIDLTDGGNVRELASTIKRDFARRRR
jgi:hypothetical protein